MQAKSILMVLSAMALVTACANDETIEINYGESISLSAVAGKQPVQEAKPPQPTV